jgi:hypothetical protein
MLPRTLVLLALLSGCHRILPLGGPGAPDATPTDLVGVDRSALLADGSEDSAGDGDAPRQDAPASTCPADDFTDPALGGLTQLKGSWSWVAPTEVRQQDLALRDAHAVLAGFTVPTSQSFSASTSVTITDINTTAPAGGAGIGILAALPADASYPFRQVSCLMLRKGAAWYWTLSACTGSSNTCDTQYDTPIVADQLSKQIELTLIADGQGQLSCAVKPGNGTTPVIVLGDASAYLSSPAIGVALITFSADARFDRAAACQ